MGVGSTISGDYSFSEGYMTTASGEISHAEGIYCIASGNRSHAEGAFSEASGSASHTEGNSTVASGTAAHSEGQYSYATGNMSHAEGASNFARATASHVEGAGNDINSSQKFIHVSGVNSVTTTDTGKSVSMQNKNFDGTNRGNASTVTLGKYAEIIGNGDSDSARSNARALDWGGNEYLNGNVYVGCNSDSSGGTRLPHAVQVNGTSVVTNGVANIPMASSSALGVVKIPSGLGIYINPFNGELMVSSASSTNIKEGTDVYRPLSPAKQHEATFFGLSKLAGVDLANETVTVGTYPTNSKTAIQSMLGIEANIPLVETVSGTTPSIIGMPNVRYVCGEVSMLTITPPASGTIVVRFESGSTATVLTVPNTVKFPAWFDATSLEANTTYELIIEDGVYGGVMAWA